MPLAYSIRVESVHEENASRRFLLFPPPKKNYSCKILRSQGSDGERRDRRRSMTPTGTLEALIFVRDSSDRISSIPSISSTPSLSPVPVSSSCSSRFYSKFRVLSHPPIERMKLEAKKKRRKKERGGEIVSNKESRILGINRSSFGH